MSDEYTISLSVQVPSFVELKTVRSKMTDLADDLNPSYPTTYINSFKHDDDDDETCDEHTITKAKDAIKSVLVRDLNIFNHRDIDEMVMDLVVELLNKGIKFRE